MKSRIFSSDYLKNTSKGQVWIPVCIAIGFLMAFPVVALMNFGIWKAYSSSEALMQSFMEAWRSVFLITGFIITFGAALINGVNGFWYLFSSSKVDFYHCLPIKRTHMFTQKVVKGLVYYLVPYVVMMFFTICIGAVNGCFSLELMGCALKLLGMHLLMYLLIYFSVVLAICLTGNILMGMLTLAGMFLYAPVLGLLIGLCKGAFFTTVGRDVSAFQATSVYSPVALCIDFVIEYVEGNHAKKLWAILIFAVILCVASFYAYKKRPMEAAGKSMVYKFVGKIVEFMVVIPSGIGIGLIFYALPGNSTRIYWGIFGLVFGTVLVHGMLQVVYQLDFRGFFSHKAELLIAGVCVAVCAVTLKMDLLGYDAYIPAYDKIEGIGFDWKNLSGLEMADLVTVREDGRYEIAWNQNRIYEDAGISPEIYEVIDKIVQKQADMEIEHLWEESLFLNYNLKSGRKVSRLYEINAADVRNLLTAFYDTGMLKENKYSFLQIDSKYLKGINGEFADGESYALFQTEKKKYDELVEALKADVQEADAEVLLEEPCALLDFYYEGVPVVDKENGEYRNSSYSGNVYVYPGFKRTLAILEETGYPLTLDEVEIEAAVYRVFREAEAAGLEMISDYIRIEDKERLEELKKCMRPYGITTSWMENDRRIDIQIEIPAIRRIQSMYIRKGEMPKFLEEQIARAEKENLENMQMPDASEEAQVDYN